MGKGKFGPALHIIKTMRPKLLFLTSDTVTTTEISNSTLISWIKTMALQISGPYTPALQLGNANLLAFL